MGIKQVNQSLHDRHIAHSTQCTRNLTPKNGKCAKVLTTGHDAKSFNEMWNTDDNEFQTRSNRKLMGGWKHEVLNSY